LTKLEILKTDENKEDLEKMEEELTENLDNENREIIEHIKQGGFSFLDKSGMFKNLILKNLKTELSITKWASPPYDPFFGGKTP
jgi:hypothetical protein